MTFVTDVTKYQLRLLVQRTLHVDRVRDPKWRTLQDWLHYLDGCSLVATHAAILRVRTVRGRYKYRVVRNHGKTWRVDYDVELFGSRQAAVMYAQLTEYST